MRDKDKPLKSISMLISGAKGYNFLRHLISYVDIDLVCSYSQKGTQCDSYLRTMNICADNGIKFVTRNELKVEMFNMSSLVFCAGWQFLVHTIDSRFIVFHDSLLPKYRGFAPTIAALIAGDQRVGVSAFQLRAGIDTGKILGQEALDVTYPATVAQIYERLGEAYAAVAKRLLQAARAGTLVGRPQNEAEATYTLWRNEDDYDIDWQRSADEVRRFIDAVGWPYMGAKTRYQGKIIRIEDAEPVSDLAFVNRQAGKIWAIGPTQMTADVVCGQGLLRIRKAKSEDGSPVRFSSLRQKLCS